MNNKTSLSNKTESLNKKLCNADICSDDNDILELQKKTLELIPTQFKIKDYKNIRPVSPPIRFLIKDELEMAGTDIITMQNGTNSSNEKACSSNIIEVQKKYSEKLTINNVEKVFYIREVVKPERRRKANNISTVKQYTVTPEDIMNAIVEQSKANTEDVDMCLDIFCRNIHGQFRNVPLSFYDEELNAIIKVWADWYKTSTIYRSTPLMYKCYACNKGWWRLHPFREHLKKHTDPYLKLAPECIHHEFNIIAFAKQEIGVKNVEMESDCWKCGRGGAFHAHSSSKPENLKGYKCQNCFEFVATCTKLEEHESTCMRDIEKDSCTICTVYIDEDTLDAHMIDYHLVRSDEPILVESEVCTLCSGRYYIDIYHDCPAIKKRYKCNVCCRNFSSEMFLQVHEKYSGHGNFNCAKYPAYPCKVPISQCESLVHCLEKSKNYCYVLMCAICDTNLLFRTPEIHRFHAKIHREKHPPIMIMLPTKALNGEFLKCDTTLQVPDAKIVHFLAGLLDVKGEPIETERTYNKQEIQDITQTLTNRKEKLTSNNVEKVFYIRELVKPKRRRKTNNITTVKQYTVTSEDIMNAIVEQSKENTEDEDMCLDIFCRNIYGQFRNVPLSFYDEELNEIIKVWADWYKISEIYRSTPLMYKCYACNKGWWRLHPFREHLKKHTDPHLKLAPECIHHEFNIIAFAKQEVGVKDVEMESDCWKCGRGGAFHAHGSSKPGNLKGYKCQNCLRFVATCTILEEHESACMRDIEDDSCTICTFYVNEDSFDAHMIDYHLVRSDEPILVESEVCTLCSGRYYIDIYHDCPAIEKRYKCDVCLRNFSSEIFLQIHEKYSRHVNFNRAVYPTNPCREPISQCVSLVHCLEKSKNYCYMFMCSVCDTKLLFRTPQIHRFHAKIHREKHPPIMIMLPTKSLNSEFLKCDTTLQVPDAKIVHFLAGILDAKGEPIETEVTFHTQEIQDITHTLTNPNRNGSEVGSDVTTLDEHDDVIPSFTSNPKRKACDVDDDVTTLDLDDVILSIALNQKRKANDVDSDVTTLEEDDDVVPSIASNPKRKADDVDNDVIILDEDDVIPARESALNSKNSNHKEFDLKAIQALDEEIMRDLEVEATICKVFEASKSYQLMMQKESLEKKLEKNRLLKKKSKMVKSKVKETKKKES